MKYKIVGALIGTVAGVATGSVSNGDYSAATQLIGTVGFPIVAYGAMFWYMVKQDRDHKEEMDKMSDAIVNNTLALQKLADAMENNND